MRALGAVGLCCVLAGCGDSAPSLVYRAEPVERRDIVISALAAGVVEPDVTVEVKSKASGEILDVLVESGDLVERGMLLVRIDQRQPRNTLSLAAAELEVAQARLGTEEAQKRRSEKLFKSESIPEAEYEQALLDHVNAKAGVVRARVAVENAQIEMDDTEVLAPITGTVIEKNVERGQVISSPIQAVSGGTVLLKMADLNLVQVRTLVDETDIGKISPGLRATVTVAAYPTRPFAGVVTKIEPQAFTEQNVTMFPVLVRIENSEGLLQPGMNSEVEIHIGSRTQALAVPNAALRTQRDVSSAARVLGLSLEVVQAQLRRPDRELQTDGAIENGAPVGAPERDTSRRVPEHDGPAEGSPRRDRPTPSAASSVFGGDYIVFVLTDTGPQARNVRVGLTDLDYSEVKRGLTESDAVLLLPSAGLVEAQERFRRRVDRMMGRGIPGMRSSGRQ